MPGLLQLRANLAADISHVVSFREVKLDFELYYIVPIDKSKRDVNVVIAHK